MTDTPTMEELQAAAAAANAALAAAVHAEANPPLTLEQATAALAKAEAELEEAERPYWDLEHAKQDLGTTRNYVDLAPPSLKAAAAAAIPEAEATLARAQAAFDAHPLTQEHTDKAAQAVLDARAAIENAQGA
jgi:hypothetical protein